MGGEVEGVSSDLGVRGSGHVPQVESQIMIRQKVGLKPRHPELIARQDLDFRLMVEWFFDIGPILGIGELMGDDDLDPT